jgi:dipeptidyl aminopeptidase/acylaminoacyl peptidase
VQCNYFYSIAFFTLLFSGFHVAAQDNALRRTEGNRTIEAIPDIAPSALARAAQYSNIRSASNSSWHPNGDSILISTRFAATRQLHIVSEPLGSRKQMTFFSEPIHSASFSPSSNQILYGRDKGGNENFQAFLLNIDSGLTRQLTTDGSRNSGLLWSPDGQQFAYMTNREDPARFDIWTSPIDKPDQATKLVTGTGFYWVPIDWSPDQSQLLVKQVVSAVDSRPFVVDIKSGKMQRLGNPDKTVSYGGFGGGFFAKDGKGVYLPSDEDSEFTHLRYIDLASGETQNLSGNIPWNVSGLTISPDGKHVAFATNEDGISRVYLLNTRSKQYRALSSIPAGLAYNLQFSPDSRRLAYTLNTATSAADVYTIALRSDKITRWTESEIGGLNPDNFVPAELVHYPTFDQVAGAPREIPAFIYRPKEKREKYPVMISIHGGPEGQVRPYFSSTVQYLAGEAGAIVITPNVRGSRGYGKTYLGLDNGLLREDSVGDIGALLEWIKTQDDMDATRVGVIGGSYGGYMVLASMVHYSDQLALGVNSFGVSNFVTFLENTSDYRRDHRRQEYGDERIPEIRDYLNTTAPMNNTDRIQKPLFVLQGANDPRVPASESEQIVSKVRSNGTEVWYVLFDDEGHGFRKKPNQDYRNAALGLFLEKHL